MAAPQPISIAASSSSFAVAQASSSSAMSSAVAAPVSAGPSASSSTGRPLDQVMHKNHLQEYAQKSNIALPIYQTVNEGFPHAPQFRSTVWVDGKCFTSPNVFSVRKAAEQDVAKLALESISSSKVKDEELPVVLEQTMFCKCILNEFAAKMNLDKVTYETVKPEGSSAFVSSLVFNGKHYIGDPAKSKKEAEQLAARAAIISNLGNPDYGTRLSETIKSKYKFCAAVFNVKDCSKTVSTSTGHDPVIAAPLATNDVAPANAAPLAAKIITPVTAASVAANINEMQVVVPESSSRVLQPQQKFEMPQQEIAPEDPKLLNVPLQACAQPSSSSTKKRKKNKKASANKKPILNTLHILEKKIKKRKEISEMKQTQGGKCQFCIHGQGHCFWELFKLKPSAKYLDTFENYERWANGGDISFDRQSPPSRRNGCHGQS